MSLFRVHLADGRKLDVAAATPTAAQAELQRRLARETPAGETPAGGPPAIRKIKRTREVRS